VKKWSPEADELAKQARREPAWPEVCALAGALLFVVVGIIVG
jgi:hypothetical protein